MEDLKNTVNPIDLTDIYGMLHPTKVTHILLKYIWNILQDRS